MRKHKVGDRVAVEFIDINSKEGHTYWMTVIRVYKDGALILQSQEKEIRNDRR